MEKYRIVEVSTLDNVYVLEKRVFLIFWKWVVGGTKKHVLERKRMLENKELSRLKK